MQQYQLLQLSAEGAQLVMLPFLRPRQSHDFYLFSQLKGMKANIYMLLLFLLMLMLHQ